MSPEQALSEKENIGSASDIYSLGAVLYTMLYLKRPYNDLDTDDTITATSDGTKLSLPEKSNGRIIPSALRAIIEKAMSLNPADRYASVEDLRNDIYLYLNDFSTHAESVNLFRYGKLHIAYFAKTKHPSGRLLGFHLLLIPCLVSVRSVELPKLTREVLMMKV